MTFYIYIINNIVFLIHDFLYYLKKNNSRKILYMIDFN